MSSKRPKKNPWTGARGRVTFSDGWIRFEVRDMHGRVVWTDGTGYHGPDSLSHHMDSVNEVVSAVRKVEGIGHKLKPYKKVNRWLL